MPVHSSRVMIVQNSIVRREVFLGKFCDLSQRAWCRVETQVPCSAGIADIVTEGKMYELKYALDRSSLFGGIGQVFAL